MKKEEILFLKKKSLFMVKAVALILFIIFTIISALGYVEAVKYAKDNWDKLKPMFTEFRERINIMEVTGIILCIYIIVTAIILIIKLPNCRPEYKKRAIIKIIFLLPESFIGLLVVFGLWLGYISALCGSYADKAKSLLFVVLAIECFLAGMLFTCYLIEEKYFKEAIEGSVQKPEGER